jgi:TorA maturation chaperone TorD
MIGKGPHVKERWEMEEREADKSEAMADAEARAGMYSFLANLFNQRPDLELVERLCELGPDGFDTVTDEEDVSPEIERGLQEMASYISATEEMQIGEVEQDLAVDWTRLFRGVSPGYGPPPPYEGVYSEGASNPSEVLQAIMRTYHEYSVDVDEEAGNRPDYIGIELDFLRHLCQSEAEAWAQGQERAALDHRAAQRKFLVNHLGRWAEKFCQHAVEEAKTDFYRGFIRLTQGVLKEQMALTV